MANISMIEEHNELFTKISRAKTVEDIRPLVPLVKKFYSMYEGVDNTAANRIYELCKKKLHELVEENEIMRPDDFIVKSTTNRSANKIYIIQSIDRKLSLEDIAQAKGLNMDSLMSEIEAIVCSGTKLNLDYVIQQDIDEDVVDEIYDYFRNEATSDSLEAAMEDLGSDYEEMEIRLVRLKFLCEVAN